MLDTFDSQHIAEYADAIRKIGMQANETEDLATGLVNLFYESLLDDNGKKQSALVRFFRTIPYGKLPDELKTKLQGRYKQSFAEQTKCLTLLSTRGDKEAWNDPRKSEAHQCIPLGDPVIMQETPMIAGLLTQLEIENNEIFNSEPGIYLEPEQKQYNVFFVPDAAGSEYIPAQETFVIPHNIQSVIGFGAQLPSGDIFALILFLHCKITHEQARRFAELAKLVETAMHDIGRRTTTGSHILIAASESGNERLRKVLEGKHRVTAVFHMNEVVRVIENKKFDLIIAGMHFDDSRTFEFLKLIKSTGRLARKPLICMLFHNTELSSILLANMESVLGIMGVKRYVRALEMSDDSLLKLIESYIPEPVWDITGTYKALK